MAIQILSRRRLLQGAAFVGAGAMLPDWFIEEGRALAAEAQKTVASPNDRPAVALIGCGGRGRGVAGEASKFGDIVAVCDVDEEHVAHAGTTWPKAKIYKDFRQAIAHPGLHVVVNGTPDHWHTLVNIHAMKQGKDVYSEKPLTLTIDEGRRLVNVANETKRILQTGSQQRSDAKFRLACEAVRNGRIGKLEKVVARIPCGRREGPFKPSPKPELLDWDFWQGQAPATEYVRERCHQMFRFWYDYSGGTTTDWGAHHNDIALWGLGMDRSGPTAITAKRLAEPIPGGYTAIPEYAIEYTYANGVKHVCMTVDEQWTGSPKGKREPLPSPLKAPPEDRNGVAFYGTEGWIWVTRGAIHASRPEVLNDPLPSDAERLYNSPNHMANFFDCIRSRKPAVCEPEIGHRSVSVCHLGVIALRLQRDLKWDPQAERFSADDEANKYLAREMRKPWSYEAVA